MAIGPGARIGPYEVTTLLGEGGMGKVWRAHHTGLKRDDALKVLPEAFASDPERLARFQREAQILASLNHPNIAHVYGLEESGGNKALVMELVEGPTLADRIAKGPIPVDDALPIARQIAEALEVAHEQGIIHRDLKPANIKVRPDGTVKVLDFGLAKLIESEPTAAGQTRDFSPRLTNSPTITTPAMTMAGVILGTAAYMSPEQAKGKAADERSDIWAFGCVLYEMFTGKRAFEGEDVSDTLASVLKSEPDWTALPADVPQPVATIIRKCLDKDRTRRIPEIVVARFLLEQGGTPATLAVPDARPASPRDAGLARALPWGIVSLLAVAIVALLYGWALWGKTTPQSILRLEVALGTDASLISESQVGASIAISPDGETLAFVARKQGPAQLYLRRFGQLQATPVVASGEPRAPFFSPDGQWVGFSGDGGARLKKVPVTGGPAGNIVDVSAPFGAWWGDDGAIVFAPGPSRQGLQRVSSDGGKPEAITTIAEGEVSQQWPQVLPGAKAVIFTTRRLESGRLDDGNIEALLFSSKARKVLVSGGSFGRYLASGHLIYVRDQILFGVPFDVDRLEVTGRPVPVLEGVNASRGGGFARYDVSSNGRLVYVPAIARREDAPIVWVDQSGKIDPLRTTAATWSNPQFAPDGKRIALELTGDNGQTDIWVYEWSRDALFRLTSGPGDARRPVWTPDGRRLVFTSASQGTTANLYWQRADGTGDVQRLTTGAINQFAGSWHPSRNILAFHEYNLETHSDDIMTLEITGDETSGWKPGKPEPFLKTPANERTPTFSPDGRFIAYSSTQSGRDEVYVRPFPTSDRQWLISSGGGTTPAWSRTRNELFYGTPDRQIMVVSYTIAGDEFHAEKPRLWTEQRFVPRSGTGGPQRSFDVHPDGKRLALSVAPGVEPEPARDKIVFVFNFFDELRRIAHVGRR